MSKLFPVWSAAVLLLMAGCVSNTDSPMACAVADIAPMYRPAPRRAAMKRTANSESSGLAKNNFQAPAGHQMAFAAQIRLSVSEVRTSIRQTRDLALKLGGYIKRMDDNSATLAIPVGNADKALEELAKTGVLLSLRIEGEDVTQQVTDLAVRLDNLEKSRQRLLALLQKAGKVDEMVKVENAITRVTTELERLQAQQKNLQGRINYVTIYVYFTATEQKPVRVPTTPIAWINQLGADLLVSGQNISYNRDSLIFDVTLPAGFVKNGTSGALSGNHCILEFHNYENAITATHWYGNDYAQMSFYEPMIEKALAERFKAPVTKVKCKIDGYDAAVFTVKPEIGKTTYIYRVAAAVVKSKVKVIIARARMDNFNSALPGSAWDKMLESVSF